MTIHLRDGQMTMALSPRSFHLFKLGIITFFVTTTLYYLFFRDRYDVHDVHDVYQVAVTGRKGAFIEDILENEIDGPYNGTALANLCRTKKWIPGLIFKCEAPQGGVGNVRNVFQNCIRYAIEAGATGFIVPEIMIRGSALTELHTERLVPFTYFFDSTHFTNTLSTACPHMRIYSHQNDLWDLPSTATPVRLLYPALTANLVPDTDSVILSPSLWASTFASRLASEHPAPFSPTRPVLVSLNTPLLQWPISYDTPEFTANFGRILRFREDVRRLAGTILYAMNKKYEMNFNPEARGIQGGKYYAAHLRTAVDASSAGWTPYELQASRYLEHAAHHHLPLIYAASGSPADIARFKDQATNYSSSNMQNSSLAMEVVTKTSLLAEAGFENEKADLEALTWDQQALVDYEVMLRASRFGGTWESSFAWMAAKRRHVVLGRGAWILLPGEKSGGGGVPFHGGSAAVGGGKVDGELLKPGSWEKGTKPATAVGPPRAGKAGIEADLSVSVPSTATSPPASGRKKQGSEERVGGGRAIEGPAKEERSSGAQKRDSETAEVSERGFPTGPQAFSDGYSIIFGDAEPGVHPWLNMQLAIWP